MTALRAVIFDLDQTLIDSVAADPLRRATRWSDVYAMIPTLAPYVGVTELLGALRASGLKTAIVTSAPRPYAERVARHWGWQLDVVVGFHDTPRRKPAPDPINHALLGLKVRPETAVYVGDHPNDIVASQAAGVVDVGALWGALDAAALRNASPTHSVTSVAELRRLLGI